MCYYVTEEQIVYFRTSINDRTANSATSESSLTLAATIFKPFNHMGKLATIKTKPTYSSVEDFINGIEDEQKRHDAKTICAMMEKATHEKPKMWGNSMIGFGEVRYKSEATGREVDWFKLGFAPRKSNFSLHLIDLQKHAEALTRLGKYKTGAGCLYINKLKDVDINILKSIIEASCE